MKLMKALKELGYEKYQNFWIKLMDKECPKKGLISKSGTYHLKGFLSKDELKKIIEFMEGIPIKKLNLNNGLEICPDLKKILKSKFVNEIIQEYLGKNATLDQIAVVRDIAGQKSNSGYWHHDSVGHRIKAFVYLGSTKNTITTEYLVGSHEIDWASYMNDKVSNESRVNKKLINEYRNEIFEADIGDVIFFDTNGIHRGIYNKSIHYRDTIQIEYSSRLKSFFVRGQIGPRDTRFGNIEIDETLINRKKLKREKDVYLY